jgi:hypothetical protein
MGGIPERRLVIEDVIFDARGGGRGPNVLTKCSTQDCWMAVVLETPVSRGLLPVMFLPVAALTPFPASELYGSVAVCAPYLATENPSRVLRFGPRLAR